MLGEFSFIRILKLSFFVSHGENDISALSTLLDSQLSWLCKFLDHLDFPVVNLPKKLLDFMRLRLQSISKPLKAGVTHIMRRNVACIKSDVKPREAESDVDSSLCRICLLSAYML